METDSRPTRRNLTTWFLVLGMIFYWGALPPFGFWPLVFLVPVAWTVPLASAKPVRLRTVYAVSLVFWLVSIWWIACPHPMTAVGLLALSGYLACYGPLFFGATRVAVHRLRIPIVLAAPVCWIGCEYLRNHLLGGFSFCSLEHALYLKPRFIQIADIGGGYLVGGMIMLVGTGVGILLAEALKSPPSDGDPTNVKRPMLPTGGVSAVLAITALLAATWYGISKTTKIRLDQGRDLRVAICQGNIPVRLDGGQELSEATFKQFVDLTYNAVHEARKREEPLDLVIWPETVCPIPVLLFQGEMKPGDVGLTDDEAENWQRQLREFVDQLETPVLFGLSAYLFEGSPEPKRLNSALLVRPGDRPIGPRYDKVHLVMFGEYIPFSGYLPDNFFLKTLCQEAGRGSGPVAVPTRWVGDDLSVNICFESTIPHLVRNQILTLKEQGANPALLVNMSNDGWFRFSRQIDQHLATHVFRAVENRRPYVTATNGGFSAAIDEFGTIRAIGRRKEAETVVATVSMTAHGNPLYHRLGDRPAFFCMIALLAVTLFGIIPFGNRKAIA